jgi:predicted nucleic acid-binding protein
LYAEVARGQITRRQAQERLDYLRRLRIRLLGDRSLQQVAWRLAERLGWPDTFVAEYLALVQLQGDALVTDDRELARAVDGVVAVATTRDLLD